MTSKLYENGHQIDGLDFSSKMISIAKSKMPKANLIEWDISNGIPPEFQNNKYETIVSTYTLHHLKDEAKISFIKTLLSVLEENGKLFIGDISFETRENLEECRRKSIDYWDHDECYFVFNEIHSSLKNDCNCEFYPLSHCGGVIVITKR
ncbi:class I SAM-dependent methyltransferase [Bacillus sp. JJ1532]|uniref:class I SAM-dependent methyltransferase n=1 Tax=Bacillus sp. JJ1532 TaxID=3122958 RepID=UPI002FFE9EB8